MDSINYRDKISDEFPKTPTLSSSTTTTINSVKFLAYKQNIICVEMMN